MLMGNNKVKTYVASGNIAPRRFVKFGASDTLVVQASAAADLVIGVSDLLGGVDTQRVEVFVGDSVDIEFGGNVTRGQLVTSDASGKAIVAGAGAAHGIAMVSAVAGDIGAIKLERGVGP